MKKAICIIPAKGHSERLPGKNMKRFFGQPIIKYAIDTARASGLFHKVVVSTDDDKIGTATAGMGAVYHKRGSGLAEATVPMVEVVLDALTEQRVTYEYVCMMYATNPFSTVRDLVTGLDWLEQGFDVVFPAFQGPHPEHSYIKKDWRYMLRYPEYEGEPSQFWPTPYHPAGQWYFADVPALFESRSFVMPHTWCIEVPAFHAVDIDTEEDWEFATVIYRYLQEKNRK